jgi:alpha-N-arabinofuranosidase
MYAAHQGGQAVRTLFLVPEISYDRDGKPANVWGLKGSASLRDKQLVLTVVNADVSEARETEIGIRGGAVKTAIVTTLTNSDIRAHNSFEQRDVVTPQSKALEPAAVEMNGRQLTYVFPPASVTKLVLALA